MWATEHALHDPARFQFTKPAFKAIYDTHRKHGLSRTVGLFPDTTKAAAVYAREGMKWSLSLRSHDDSQKRP